jgi:hypothetical protein
MHAKPDLESIPVATLVKPAGTTRLVRFLLIAMAIGLAGVFGVAAYLNPYQVDGTPKRMATHTQVGLPACNFVSMTGGQPCPSCGMTTSFALLIRGDLGASLQANWVGTLLAAFWAGLLVWSVAAAATGRFWFVPAGRGELVTTVIVGTFLVLMLGRWVGVLIRGQ